MNEWPPSANLPSFETMFQDVQDLLKGWFIFLY
jgi:hypothetical protein